MAFFLSKKNTAIGIVVAGILLIGVFVFLYMGGLAGTMHQGPVHVRILAVNDFHGHLYEDQQLNNRSAGSAPVLAAYLKSAMNSSGTNETILALLGDTVGASPRNTSLLMDEPSVLFFNMFADPDCLAGDAGRHDRCNVIAIPGNHEFNRGTGELLRMVYGGNGNTTIPHLVDPYPGTEADYICANVVWKENGTPVFSPYTVREENGTRIGFIGAVTTETTGLEFPENIRDVEILNESEAINRYVPVLQKEGVHAIVVLLHEGGSQDAYDGPTRKGGNVTGPVTSIVSRLDPDVDVVLSAHKHGFTNAYLSNSGNKPVLVTQAYAYGVAYADVELGIDPVSDEIVTKSARIVPVYADQSPGTTPDPEAETLVKNATAAFDILASQVISPSAENITRSTNPAGESALGDLVADSERAATGADVAFVVAGDTPGGLHADLYPGNITWADLEAVLPADASIAAEYGGWYSRPHISTRNLTGEQIKGILEKQWMTPAPNGTLSVSGLAYTYDPSQSAGDIVTEMLIGGKPVRANATYVAAMNYYMAYGMGGEYSPSWDPDVTVSLGPEDINALIAYIRSMPAPLDVQTDGRVRQTG